VTLYEWLQQGMELGFILPPPDHSGKQFESCWTHDGIAQTDEEAQAFEAGEDPCLHVIRLNPNP